MQVVDSEGYLKVKLVGGPVGPFVPYTGATANVDLGEYEIKVGQLTLDTSPTGTAAVGTTRWNDSIGSSETTLKGGSVILKNGVDLVARVVNKVTPNTTLTKANYPAVRVSGAQGQRLAIAYAQANNDNNSADTIGLVIETIATNQEGFIMTVGQLEGINTTGSLQGETWVDGDVLYLSPTTPGALTNIKPTGLTGHIVVMGYVEYAHVNNGKIYVKIMNGWELDELHNVYINPATLANNNILQYDSTDQLWKNQVLSTGLTIGTTPISSGTIGRILFEGTGNVLQESANLTYSSASNIATIAGINLTTNVSGSFISVNEEISIQSTSLTRRIDLLQSSNVRLRVAGTTGNVLINTTTDAGFRLDVNGTARVQGALTVTSNITISSGAGVTAPFFSGTANNFQFGISGVFGTQSNSVAVASGLRSSFIDSMTWVQSSGTGEYASFRATPTYNTTGTYSGIVRGFHYNPTLTSMTGVTHRAIETTSGDIIFNGGNVGIGTSTFVGSIKLAVNGLIGGPTFSSTYLDLTGGTPELRGNSGIGFYGSAGNHIFYGSSSAERMRIVGSTGNLLINTTTDAGFKLDVNGTARINTLTIGLGTGQVSTNTAIGSSALLTNTTGSENTAVGFDALRANTTGQSNVAVGRNAMTSNTTGGNNASFGRFALRNNTTGTANTSLGNSAMNDNTTGGFNIGIGSNSLVTNTSGSNNIGIGANCSSGNFDASIILGRDATATASNQFVVGSTTYNAGSVTTEVNTSTQVWNVVINGVARKILLA